MPKKSEKRSELAERVCRHLHEHGWMRPGLRVGLAVSGGADSVGLLLVLLELREELGIVVSVVHFNHQLRGRASNADEKFVAKLAARHGVPFFVEREDIARKAKRERANLEDAARLARYAFFERLVSAGQVDKIAVAHTADDQAETVLGHILRGTGLAGLGGIHPVVGCVFRPLLKIRRAELRKYLRARRQTWREDTTNRDTKRMRARIRHKLIPLLAKRFQPAVVEHLCQLADLAREDDACMERAAEACVQMSAEAEKGGFRIAIADLIASPAVGAERIASPESRRVGHPEAAMSKRMIRVLAKKVKPWVGQLSKVHVDAVLQLATESDGGKTVQLPGGVEVRRTREVLYFRPLIESSIAKNQQKTYCYSVDLGSGETELRVEEASCGLRFTVIDWPAEGRDTTKIETVLDRDVLGVPLVVRNWRPGDRMQPRGHQKGHRVARLLNELGVSRWEKVSLPVLEAHGKVVWVRGLPVAAEFGAQRDTRKAVVITEVPLTEK